MALAIVPNRTGGGMPFFQPEDPNSLPMGEAPPMIATAAQTAPEPQMAAASTQSPSGIMGFLQNPDNQAKMMAFGQGLSQLGAGQAPNIAANPAYQAMMQRQQEGQQRKQMAGLLDGLPPEMRRVLAQMPPQLAQKIILEYTMAQMAPKEPVKLPTSVQEFQYAQENPEFASFLEGRSGPQNVVNVGPGQTEYDKKRGAAMAERMTGYETAAAEAAGALSSLDVMEQAMNDPSFYSGANSGAVLTAKRVAASLGFDPEGIDSMEAFQSQANAAALAAMGGSLGAGFSNADRDFVTSQVPGLGNTPEGNRRIIQIQRAIQERKLQVAQLAMEYERENGQLDAGFNDFVRQWAEQNPVFPKSASASPSTGASTRKRYNPETGRLE